ncbi:MAG: hypothetical protein CL666_04095 [Balneola sp.]|nr:hypothetical protein [Balneola sp.]
MSILAREFSERTEWLLIFSANLKTTFSQNNKMTATHQKNVLLVVEEAAGAHALRLLLESNHILAGVLTSGNLPDTAKYQDESLKDADANTKPPNSNIAAKASSLGIPVFDAKKVQDPDFAKWMGAHQIDVLLNVHSLYRICPEVVHAVRIGGFNLHPGPLPGYSGLNVPSWAIYNEEPTHAVTLHYITDKIDTGHIVYETQFPLTAKDTGLTVSLKCVQKGLQLIERLLKELSRVPFYMPSQPQELGERRFYKRFQIPGNGFIQWTDPAHKIDAFIRACNYSPFPSPWGEPKTRWRERNISILKAEISNKVCDDAPGTVGPMVDGKTAIATADYWVLIDKCKVDGEPFVAASFLAPGDKLIAEKN